MPIAKLRKAYKLLDPEIRAKNLAELKRSAKGMLWELMRPVMPDPIFIVGCSRSGTTVTYETLAASPALLSIGHEIPQFWNRLTGPHSNGWESEAAGAEQAKPEHRSAALRYFYERLGSGTVLDKTCINMMRIPYLHALFPHARFVYIQRDGRDNVSSMIDGWRQNGHFGLRQFLGPFPCKVAIDGGRFDEWSFFLPPGWRDYNLASLEEVCAYQWITANRMALDASAAIPAERWIRLRYEDIFERPVEMYREVFAHLDLPFDAAIEDRCRTLNARPTSIVKGPPRQQKWREQNPELITRILPMIHPMMTRLGYDADA
jgi:hypothetical protein